PHTHARGSFSVNLTVWRSTASILSTSSSVCRLALPLMPRNRSYVYFTSSAVSSRPLTGGFGCQRTPRRSLKTYVVSLGRVHDSATSASTGDLPGRTHGHRVT